MLVEIKSDKFIENEKIRPPITFNPGLNTVLGNNKGSNSIGKSTFLMILDFVFGGEDYINKSVDVQKNIGVHTIDFKFKFNEEDFYFSRSTGDYTVVNICNENYETIDTISVDEYTEFLSEQYKLNLPNLTLRGAIARFFRVYQRETTDEQFPLRSAIREPEKDGITALTKIFNKYKLIMEQQDIVKNAKAEEKSFKDAQKFKHIKSVKNRTEFKKNEKQISLLNEKLDNLMSENSKGLSDVDSLQAKEISELRSELSILKRERIQLESQKKSYEIDSNFLKFTQQRDFEALLEFFPNANIKRIEEIEGFHKQVRTVLTKEFKQSRKNIIDMINSISSNITILEEKITSVSNIPNVSQAVLTQYADLQNDIEQLKDANNNFLKLNKLKDRSTKLSNSFNILLKDVLSEVEKQINKKMKDLNDIIYDGTKTAPELIIKKHNSYSFYTPNDSGTGAQYKGLVIFDIAMLALTDIPLVVHDSLLLKQIEDEAIEKIIEIYTSLDKQVFISLDKISSYPEGTQEILNKTKVLELYPGGGELFGYSWNKTN